jgi:ATP-dependent Zn protease
MRGRTVALPRIEEHTMPKPIADIAYHEAGHAVIALKLGFGVTKVTLKPRPNSVTAARTDIQAGPATPTNIADAEALNIKVDLAGALSEQLVSSTPLDELFANGSRGDWRHAKWTARQWNTRSEAEVLIVMLALETATLVQEHKETIVRVASALLEHKTLTGDEIKRIVRRAR